jgi:hypothetical protein
VADPEVNANADQTVSAEDLYLPRTTGLRWEVVRITAPLGLEAIARCHRRVTLGPIWSTPARDTVEIVVAPGTVPTWPSLRGTVCAVANQASELARGRRWIVPPAKGRPAATDAYELAEAVTNALVRRALTSLARTGGGTS